MKIFLNPQQYCTLLTTTAATDQAMSNFASLLNNFEQTAKRGANDAQGNGQKRARVEKETENERGDLPPRDMRQLSVRVSFLCIGAQKAGTTWLYELLKKVPDVGLPERKEVHFWDWHRRKGLGWYSRQFPPGYRFRGEITPCYMALPEQDVKEIRFLFPNVRIVFLARDLVDRAWSALTMELRNEARGLKPGEFDVPYDKMDATTRRKLERDADPNNYDDEFFMKRLREPTHTKRSDYAGGLKLWLKHFSKDQILVLDYSDIAKDPSKLLARVLEHIGVSNAKTIVEGMDETDLKKKVNVGLASNVALRPSLRQKMERYLKSYADEFAQLRNNELCRDDERPEPARSEAD